MALTPIISIAKRSSSSFIFLLQHAQLMIDLVSLIVIKFMVQEGSCASRSTIKSGKERNANQVYTFSIIAEVFAEVVQQICLGLTI